MDLKPGARIRHKTRKDIGTFNGFIFEESSGTYTTIQNSYEFCQARNLEIISEEEYQKYVLMYKLKQ